MSKQESYSVLTEPEPNLLSATRHLTVQVNKAGLFFKIKGAGHESLSVNNDDTVVWHFTGITQADNPAIVFTDKLDSNPGGPDKEPKISIGLHENKPGTGKPKISYTAHYGVTLKGIPLT